MAYRLACEQLAKTKDIEHQCRKSGARCQVIDREQIITIDFLSQPYRIVLPGVTILKKDAAAEVPLREKILILHYFTQAQGTPLSNKPIAYKDLPEGTNYFPTFTKRAIKPLTDHFSGDLCRLLAAAERLGGHKANYGDVSVTIPAFSRVPVTFVLWRGDEEFPPAGSILFDSTIKDYLSIEDINVLCETIAWRLVKLAKIGGDNHSMH